MRSIILALILVFIVGCSKQDESAPAEETDTPQEEQQETGKTSVKEEVQSVVDAAIGAQAIEQGEKAKDKVRRLNEERNRQIDEFSDL